jgi:hypothetical protein
MKTKIIILFIAVLSTSVFSQEFISDFTWNFGFTADRLNEYIPNNSYKGFGIEGRRFFDKNISGGLSLGWNIFDQRIAEPITIDQEGFGGTISGTQIRYVNAFPLLANLHYYVGKRRDFRFFLGGGVGVYYILQRLDLGVWRLESNNWHFGLAPEAGILIPLGDGQSHIILTGRYNYAFSSGKSISGSEDNSYSYWSLNFGFAFSSRL